MFAAEYLNLNVLLQPIGSPSVQDLFPQPDQSDESAKCAQYHKTAVKYISSDIFSIKNKNAFLID